MNDAAARRAFATNREKWSPVLMDAGWTAFSSIIIEFQSYLELSPVDLCILLHLSTYWWTVKDKPFPAKARLARAIGITPRSVQRRIAAMEKRGYIRREARRGPNGSSTNRYDLSGLIEAAKPWAEAKCGLIKYRVREKRSRQRRDWNGDGEDPNAHSGHYENKPFY